MSPAPMKRIYVCHPFADDPAGAAERVRAICRALVADGYLPIAPHLYLPAFLDEATERDTALHLCVALVGCCDALWFYGTRITPGMEREIATAHERGIPVVNRLHPATEAAR